MLPFTVLPASTCQHGAVCTRGAGWRALLASTAPRGQRRRRPSPRSWPGDGPRGVVAEKGPEPPSWRMPEFNTPGGAETAEPGAGAPGGRAAGASPRTRSPRTRPRAARKAPPPLERKKKTFEERYEELALFYMEHGHCVVPVNTGLGGWVAYQRRLWKAGELPLDHYHALAALGFQFDAFAARWAARFQQLSEFHSQYGHCTVPCEPQSEARWPGLRQWTIIQRQAWKRGLLEDDRVRRLSGLGFVWQPGEVRWEERFAELQAFKQEHGHCNVPKGWAGNQGLASWVEAVRTKWRSRQGERTLSHEREARLRELGFEFEPQRQSWQERYAQLAEFKAREGHLAGPFPSKGPWVGLAEWVTHQRHKARAGRLHPDRKQALDELGFAWEVEEANWAARLVALDQLLARVGPQMAQVLLEGGSRTQALKRGAGEAQPASSQAAAQSADGSGKWPRQRAAAPPAAAGLKAGAVQLGEDLPELLRWYRSIRRQAARGELRPERAQQLAQRGLELPQYVEPPVEP